MIKNFLNPKGHQNPTSGSKVMAILLKGWIWPIGRVALGSVYACNQRSRLVQYVFYSCLRHRQSFLHLRVSTVDFDNF